MCQMPHNERLELIAEGLPVVFQSAQGFWDAAEVLKERHREADVLEGFAEEEAAKILILMDIVRCPPSLVSSKIGLMVSRFYDHLARLLYAEAQRWKPMHVSQLREYVDEQRRAHYLEGYAGEYILPNWNIARRESQLYADIEAYEDGAPTWNAPTGYASGLPRLKPVALRVAESLSNVGAYSLKGVQAIANFWGTTEFKDTENWQDSENLTRCLLETLIAEGLPSERASEQDMSMLYDSWQMPMYNLEFKLIDVPLEDLERERDAMLWAEAGYDSEY
ncbi:hypothetical protein IYY11_21460 [Methylocystis sp. H62]|nr:hypothetical protein [Methylocystis sp. H62]